MSFSSIGISPFFIFYNHYNLFLKICQVVFLKIQPKNRPGALHRSKAVKIAKRERRNK